MNTKYTIVIPEYKEKNNLKETIANIKATQKNFKDIQHINDVECMGTSYSRHKGIEKAETDIIITCDAHMRFMPEALDKMAEYIANSNKDLLCCLTCHYNETLDFEKSAYTGAKLLWKQDEINSKKVLSAVWDSNTVGEIPAVMGGCYGFKKSSYKKIGEPWKLGIGWGNDEETLSIAFRLIGGSVELLKYRCAHLYLHNKQSNNLTPEQKLARLWYNRIRNLHYLPIDEKLALELQNYILSSPDLKDKSSAVMKLINDNMSKIKKCKEILVKNQKISFDEFAKKWVFGYQEKESIKVEIGSIPKRILKHECMSCTLKHLATARELLYRKNDMIMILGHLACAFNHSGIKDIDYLINEYEKINPKDVTKVIQAINLEQEFEMSKRSEKSTEKQCLEYLAISTVIAMEIATGYNTEEYHSALLGNLSIAQDLAVLKNAELANRIRGIRLWLYPDGVRIATFRKIDIELIKNMAELNFSIEPTIIRTDSKPCSSCGKKK